ncbi:hypothetical protein N7490_003532 [Penicillium lividum]|nr:hypothetical protein N7490_003532 [Penicillium lividum]
MNGNPLTTMEHVDNTDKGRAIFLNGFLGVGKLAIAKAFAEKLPTDDRILLDNHLLIDPVDVTIPGCSKRHKDRRRRFRQVAFDALKEDPTPDLHLSRQAASQTTRMTLPCSLNT